MSSLIRVSIIISCVLCFSNSTLAQDYKHSAGIRLGTYVAGSFKTFISEKQAVELIAGIGREGGNSITTVGGFYQVHNAFAADTPTLKWYFGGGAFIGLGNSDIKTNVALAGIIGLEYTFDTTPINIFIDGTPYLSLTNDFAFDAEASLGVRYIF
ncbi:MAG: hypothetical protein ACJA1A_001613 [Saprospiraceae bacterium]|jgi:hypothetical protein|tara:strand:+ start:1792 stop:2256 length:465 start_codon:yes stop_codon:yes gene_type:complete